MSEIGKEVRAMSSDDMGVPSQFKGHIDENGAYVPTPEEEAEMHEDMRLAELRKYTDEELYAELDSRITSTQDVLDAQARRKK